MRVLILNGYSASNRGDGLLVELAVGMVRAALGTEAEIVASVQDPLSFGLVEGARVIGTYSRRGGPRMAAAAGLALLSRGRFGFSREFSAAFHSADLLVSVGGAYLRGSHPTELFKSMLAHGAQVRAASASAKPWVMLPQSIGPYHPWVRAIVAKWISRARTVFLRDDTSMREFAALTNIARVPDSAILAIAESLNQSQTASSRKVGLVVRALRDGDQYEAQTVALLSARDIEWVPLLQSSTAGNDDRVAYASFGLTARRTLADELKTGELGAVVSVRLHGALESILRGVPAVHLSYERKGYSAFADLGLDAFVFNARDYAWPDVLKAVETTLDHPSEYWEAVDSRRADIRHFAFTVRAALAGAARNDAVDLGLTPRH